MLGKGQVLVCFHQAKMSAQRISLNTTVSVYAMNYPDQSLFIIYIYIYIHTEGRRQTVVKV